MLDFSVFAYEEVVFIKVLLLLVAEHFIKHAGDFVGDSLHRAGNFQAKSVYQHLRVKYGAEEQNDRDQ